MLSQLVKRGLVQRVSVRSFSAMPARRSKLRRMKAHPTKILTIDL